MWSWLENAWVVGILGGVVSGIIVFLITNWLFSGQGKREIARRIGTANQEVVLAVRQGIPENTIPTAAVLYALIKATARKHGVRDEELYGPPEVAQDLIKEVMDSSFISAQTKEDYCKRLADLDAPPKPLSEAESTALEEAKIRWSANRSNLAGYLSASFALTAGLMSAVLGFFVARGGNDVFDVSNTATAVLVPILVTSVGAAFSIALLGYSRGRANRAARDAAEAVAVAAEAAISARRSHAAKRPKPDEPTMPA